MRLAIRTRHIRRGSALVALAATFAVLAVTAPGAGAAPAASATPTNRCWLDVVNDWLHHNGEIRGTYAVPCYTQAIQHLNLYPDVRQYSNAAEDIQRALLAALRQDRGNGPGAGGIGPTTGPDAPSGPGGGTKPPGHHDGFLGSFTPSSAQSIPLPLVVLGILALVLLAAAAATWFTRRLQARRPRPGAPQPAHAPATPPKHR